MATTDEGRMRRAMTSLLTAIGLGGTTTDVIETVLEREHLPTPERATPVSGPLHLMMAKTIQPGARIHFHN